MYTRLWLVSVASRDHYKCYKLVTYRTILNMPHSYQQHVRVQVCLSSSVILSIRGCIFVFHIQGHDPLEGNLHLIMHLCVDSGTQPCASMGTILKGFPTWGARGIGRGRPLSQPPCRSASPLPVLVPPLLSRCFWERSAPHPKHMLVPESWSVSQESGDSRATELRGWLLWSKYRRPLVWLHKRLSRDLNRMRKQPTRYWGRNLQTRAKSAGKTVVDCGRLTENSGWGEGITGGWGVQDSHRRLRGLSSLFSSPTITMLAALWKQNTRGCEWKWVAGKGAPVTVQVRNGCGHTGGWAGTRAWACFRDKGFWWLGCGMGERETGDGAEVFGPSNYEEQCESWDRKGEGAGGGGWESAPPFRHVWFAWLLAIQEQVRPEDLECKSGSGLKTEYGERSGYSEGSEPDPFNKVEDLVHKAPQAPCDLCSNYSTLLLYPKNPRP